MNRGNADWELLCASAEPRPDAARMRELLGRPGPHPDWRGILELAQRHGMTPLLARALEIAGALEEIPASDQEALRAGCQEHLFSTLRLTAELGRICARLEACGVESAAVKGPVLAQQAYGGAGLRQYADLDLLVRQRDIAQATWIFLEDGYTAAISRPEAAGRKFPGQYSFWREKLGVLVELHTERTLRYFVNGFPVEEFFARRERVRVEGQSVPALAAEDALVFLCVHGSKHFWERLLWVADVAAFARRHSGMDWRKAFAVARQTGTERMLKLGLLLAAGVLVAELPEGALAEAQGDRAAARFAETLAARLSGGEEMTAGAVERARMRAWMCGGGWRGTTFVLRLLFRPTEEDWDGETGRRSPAWKAVLGRPLRLARKYRGGLRKPQK